MREDRHHEVEVRSATRRTRLPSLERLCIYAWAFTVTRAHGGDWAGGGGRVRPRARGGRARAREVDEKSDGGV